VKIGVVANRQIIVLSSSLTLSR